MTGVFANGIFKADLSDLSINASSDQEQINVDTGKTGSEPMPQCVDAYRSNPSSSTSNNFTSSATSVLNNTSRFSSQSSVWSLNVDTISSDTENDVWYYWDIFAYAHTQSRTYDPLRTQNPPRASDTWDISTPAWVREIQRIMRYIGVTEGKQWCLTCLDGRLGIHTISRFVACLPKPPEPCDNVTSDFVYRKYKNNNEWVIQEGGGQCCYDPNANLTEEQKQELEGAGIDECPKEKECKQPLISNTTLNENHHCCLPREECTEANRLIIDGEECIVWDPGPSTTETYEVCKEYLATLENQDRIPLCPEPEPECVKKDEIEQKCDMTNTTEDAILEAGECTDKTTQKKVAICCDNGEPPTKDPNDPDGGYTCEQEPDECNVVWDYSAYGFKKDTCCFPSEEEKQEAITAVTAAMSFSEDFNQNGNSDVENTAFLPFLWQNTFGIPVTLAKALNTLSQDELEADLWIMNSDKVSICGDENEPEDCKEEDGNMVNEKWQCVCDPSKRCCGIKLNTYVPFVCDDDPGNDRGEKTYRCCIQFVNSNGVSTADSTTQVNQLNAFPFLISWLMKILMVAILVVSFGAIVVWGLMMTIPWQYSTGKNLIIHVVWAIAILWASGVILFMINPNFFR